jgi:hypothetical protein
MRFKRVIFFISFILPAISLFSQDTDPGMITYVEDLIEKIARDSEEEIDYTNLFNDLIYYLENPVNLNTASYEELERLHFLTDFQISSLMKFIQDNGELLTIYELPLVYGFTEETAMRIQPFITVMPSADRDLKTEPGGFRRNTDHQLFIRTSSVLQPQAGYADVPDSVKEQDPNAYYSGSRVKLYSRYAFEYKNMIHAGFTAEKDAGEEFFKGSNPAGFDFNSAYIQLSNTWKIKDLILGDFMAGFGQGLNTWSGLAFAKSPDVMNLRRKSQGISRYTSTDENAFFRGLAASFVIHRLEITGFVSHKKIDANIAEIDSMSEEPVSFSSFQTSGIHALPMQIEDENALGETVFGGNITYKFDRTRIGISATHYLFDAEFEKKDDPSDFYSFYGSHNTNYSIDYYVQRSKLSFFGEAGISNNMGFAMLNGALIDLKPPLTFSILHRLYQKDYQALYANAFSENTTTSNENGLYLGISAYPLPAWTFTGYVDAFSFPWLKYNHDSPSAGFDYMLQVNYHKKDGLNSFMRFQGNQKPVEITGSDSGIDSTMNKMLYRLRFHFEYPVSPVISFQDRVEFSFSKMEGESLMKGYLVFHDVIFKPVRCPVSLTFRYAMFDTDGWDPRIYAYEHDVLYSFSIPAYHDRGIRTYLNARYTVNKHMDFWLKLSDSYYPQKQSIGSGPDEIEGKHKTDLRAQVRIRF